MLLGSAAPDGSVACFTPRLTVDKALVERASRGRTPEARFRFAQPCAEGDCAHWVEDRCAVIDAAVSSPQMNERPRSALPRCSIRASCRWFAQWSVVACGVCPLVIHDPQG